MLAIIKKEMNTYFRSMTGYIFLGFLVLVTAIYFCFINILQLTPDYSAVLAGVSIMFLILIPTLTMRLFAEESRQKTDQLLFTSPVAIAQVVIGKYISALGLFLIGMAITAAFPMMIAPYGELPVAHIIAAFLGYILLGAAFISVGMFISVLTDNQVVAAVATFAVLFLLFIMGSIAPSLPADRTSSIVFICAVVICLAYIIYDSTRVYLLGIVIAAVGLGVIVALYFSNNLVFDGIMVNVFQWFSVMSRFENFNKGVLNLSDIVYFVTFAAAFIYLSVNAIEKRRWR